MVREDLLNEPLARFFQQRVFGAYRKALLAALSHDSNADSRGELAARRVALVDEIEELQVRQANLIRELEGLKPTGDTEVDDAWRTGIRAASPRSSPSNAPRSTRWRSRSVRKSSPSRPISAFSTRYPKPISILSVCRTTSVDAL
jgi:hypothetical protein